MYHIEKKTISLFKNIYHRIKGTLSGPSSEALRKEYYSYNDITWAKRWIFWSNYGTMKWTLVITSHSKTTRESIGLQESGKNDFQSSSVMDCGMRSTFHKESILIICFSSTIRVTFWRSFEMSEDETLVNEAVSYTHLTLPTKLEV